ncbi:hypothetical protein WJX75_001565 [Coccomyxa subellipsoidea]|uniref:PQ-loop-domain-containing protein n=1 Tax=Coccomyxa subellipsoidea TaxID=248742 RepID=A0ABR2YEL0_9CHLO
MQKDGPRRSHRMSRSRLARFQAILEEGHAAAGITITTALTLGLILGFILPTDKEIPAGYARLSSVFGWTYFACWWVGWYPQLIQNFLGRTVVGISFDFSIYNFIGFVCYSTFNCALYFSPSIRREYRRWHGGYDSDVRANDVAFSLHCNLMTVLGLTQIILFEKGGQKVSRLCWTACSLVGLVCAAYLGAVLLGLRNFSTLGFLYLLGYVKLAATIIKYLPQMWLNHKRRTTDGWNISNALTDMSGGFFSLAQQILDAYALQDISIVTGDIVKLALGLVSIMYCLILAGQHYFMYQTPADKLGRIEEGESGGAEEATLLDGRQATGVRRDGQLSAQAVL